MSLVAITRLRLRSLRHLPSFLARSLLAAFQARRAEGSFAVRILAESPRVFWTLTLWSGEPAMRAYVRAGNHRKAMGRIGEWCDEASTAQWWQDGSGLPAWAEGQARLAREGRAIRLDHPSEAHLAFRIPAPRAGWPGLVMRLK